jgi:4,5-dihydroxyphthalate decarboxylase
MAPLSLTLACGDYDRTLALETGAVRPEGAELNVLTLGPEETFYRMARFREFDVSETLETLAGCTFRQGLAPRRLPVAEMFWASTLAT